MKVAIAGTGNAAWHFAQLARQAGHELVGVWGRNSQKRRSFCDEIGVASLEDPALLAHAHLVILAVKDDAVGEVSEALPPDAIVVHVSGSLPMQAITQSNRGVIWPMQTLTSGHPIDYSKVPFCIEGESSGTLEVLHTFLEWHSPKMQVTVGNQRLIMHLAAVFACNFSNHLYAIASDLIRASGMSFDMLIPLIEATAMKVKSIAPPEAQTGPARRGDQLTLERHLHLLRNDPDKTALYELFTQLIQHSYGNKL